MARPPRRRRATRLAGGQDRFARRPQRRPPRTGARAVREEIGGVPLPPGARGRSGVFCDDESSAPTRRPEVLSKLKPAFRTDGKSVTAGNSSGLKTGRRAAGASEPRPGARLVRSSARERAAAGRAASWGWPVAHEKALPRARLHRRDERIELNEAFAARCSPAPAARPRDHDPGQSQRGHRARHPLGMSGARLAARRCGSSRRPAADALCRCVWGWAGMALYRTGVASREWGVGVRPTPYSLSLLLVLAAAIRC